MIFAFKGMLFKILHSLCKSWHWVEWGREYIWLVTSSVDYELLSLCFFLLCLISLTANPVFELSLQFRITDTIELLLPSKYFAVKPKVLRNSRSSDVCTRDLRFWGFRDIFLFNHNYVNYLLNNLNRFLKTNQIIVCLFFLWFFNIFFIFFIEQPNSELDTISISANSDMMLQLPKIISYTLNLSWFKCLYLKYSLFPMS